mmetsp:Transcript_24708/g.51692  ORF Transcript_24708/g.51692 Transcript_24708/m.51692 type:complete len:209 (+) Transcript_24708:485-1111(+)
MDPEDARLDYSPDSGYDVNDMEMDGQYLGDLARNNFCYEHLDKELEPPTNIYNGPGPCLRRGDAGCFKTVFKCVKVCGGMSYTFFCQLTANSNQYTHQNMNEDGMFAGRTWQNISVREMICWDIAHSLACKGLWTVNTEAGNTAFWESIADDSDLVPNTKEVKAVGYCIKRSHPIYKELAKKYGVTGRRGCQRTEADPEKSSDGDVGM